MVAGICCKLMNTLYFKDMVTLYYVFIPEMIFINAIFGWGGAARDGHLTLPYPDQMGGE